MGYDSAGDFYPLQFDALLRPKRKADVTYTFTWFQLGGADEAQPVGTRAPVTNRWMPTEAQLKEYEGNILREVAKDRPTYTFCVGPLRKYQSKNRVAIAGTQVSIFRAVAGIDTAHAGRQHAQMALAAPEVGEAIIALEIRGAPDMTSFRCIAMSTDAATRLRSAVTDDFGYAIHRFDQDRTYPCRHCLREASGKTGVLLLSYQTPKPKSVYGQPTAIFLCVRYCARFDQSDTIPDIVSNRLVSFRAFRCDGMMVYEANEIVEGNNHDAAVRRIFARDEVAYINAHTAKPGCLLCHIERA